MESAPSAAAAIGAEHSVVHWSGIYLQRKMGERGIPALTPLHQRRRAQKTSVGRWTPPLVPLWSWMKKRELKKKAEKRTEINAERSESASRPGPNSHISMATRGPCLRPGGEWKWRWWSVRAPSGSLCGEWSETARGCICSAWTTPQLPSVCLFIEMKWKKERERQNKISTGAISPITSLPPSLRAGESIFLLFDSVALSKWHLSESVVKVEARTDRRRRLHWLCFLSGTRDW